jgi:hypothetical protein
MARIRDASGSTSLAALGAHLGRSAEELSVEERLLALPILLREAVARGMIDATQALAIAKWKQSPHLAAVLEAVYRRKLDPAEIGRLDFPA